MRDPKKTARIKWPPREYHCYFFVALYWQKDHVRELELEPGKKYKMITLASKPPIFGKELSIWESCWTLSCQNERRIGQIAVIAKLNLVNLSPLSAFKLCSMLDQFRFPRQQTFICFSCQGNHRKTIVWCVSLCESYVKLLFTWSRDSKLGYITVLSLVKSSCLEIWNFFNLTSYIMHISPLMFIYSLMCKNWFHSSPFGD